MFKITQLSVGRLTKVWYSIDLMVDRLLGLILTYNLYFKFNTYGLIQFLIRVFL